MYKIVPYKSFSNRLLHILICGRGSDFVTPKEEFFFFFFFLIIYLFL